MLHFQIDEILNEPEVLDVKSKINLFSNKIKSLSEGQLNHFCNVETQLVELEQQHGILNLKLVLLAQDLYNIHIENQSYSHRQNIHH